MATHACEVRYSCGHGYGCQCPTTAGVRQIAHPCPACAHHLVAAVPGVNDIPAGLTVTPLPPATAAPAPKEQA